MVTSLQVVGELRGMDWVECEKKRLVKEIKPDNNLIQSLIKSSENKLKSQELLKLTDDTAGSKISLAYDSLRELLEALSIKKGYKIYNHSCYTSFLKQVMKESVLGDEFDDVRKIRNSINYYGKSVGEEEALSVIKKVKALIDRVERLLG